MYKQWIKSESESPCIGNSSQENRNLNSPSQTPSFSSNQTVTQAVSQVVNKGVFHGSNATQGVQVPNTTQPVQVPNIVWVQGEI